MSAYGIFSGGGGGGGEPYGPAGGDLGGTYPDPSVTDDSHSHTAATLPATMVPSAHAASHQNNGSDEISVAGLSGLLADAQTPAAHTHSGDALGVLTQLDVDNLRADGNTISSTNANGNIEFDPNGSGEVRILALTRLLDGTTYQPLRTGDVRVSNNTTNDPKAFVGSGGYIGIYHTSEPNLRFTRSTNAENGHDAGLSSPSAGRVKVTNGTTGVGALLLGKGSDIASANDITLGNANYFVVTGTTQVNTIAATSWIAGSMVVLQFSGSLTVKHNTAGTGASLLLAGAADFAATAGDMLTLLYDGTTWRETARTVI